MSHDFNPKSIPYSTIPRKRSKVTQCMFIAIPFEQTQKKNAEFQSVCNLYLPNPKISTKLMSLVFALKCQIIQIYRLAHKILVWSPHLYLSIL